MAFLPVFDGTVLISTTNVACFYPSAVDLNQSYGVRGFQEWWIMAFLALTLTIARKDWPH
jgi:hypothetical protein